MCIVTIYHNPRCSKSRETLELIRARGIEPEIVLYLDSPPDIAMLASMLKQMNMTARELLRTNERAYEELKLSSEKWTDQDLIGFMHAHPILMNRPIVRTGLGVRLGRPPESVLEIL